MMRGLTGLIAVLAVLTAAGPAGAAGCHAPADELHYRVLWGDDDVGSHDMTFTRDGDTLRVRIRTRIDADLMLVNVLDLKHDGEEIWRDGRFESYRGQTVSNDNVFDVSVAREDDGYRLDRNGLVSHIPANSIPGSLWCESIIGPPGEAFVIDYLKGRLRHVRIEAPAPSDIESGGRALPTTRHQIVDGYDSEIWFDEAAIGLRARFPAKMGPMVILDLAGPGRTGARQGSRNSGQPVDPAGGAVKNER